MDELFKSVFAPLIVASIVGLLSFVTSHYVLGERVKNIKDDIKKVEDWLTRLEGRVNALPSFPAYTPPPNREFSGISQLPLGNFHESMPIQQERTAAQHTALFPALQPNPTESTDRQ